MFRLCSSARHIYESYADGKHARLHELFGNAGKLSIIIQLFYNGLRTTNPLHGQNSINNIGVFRHNTIHALQMFSYWLNAIQRI